MKSLLLSALFIGILVVLMLKPWVREPGAPPTGTGDQPTAEFLRACEPAGANVDQPERYCRCLWSKGVRRVTELATSASARRAVALCGGGLIKPHEPAGPESP
jgi:hypothetical protein